MSSASGLVGRDAAAFEVEERGPVELADGGAMRAFDVVGEDFELGLGVDRRGAGEQQALQRLLAVGLLRVAGDLDPGGDRAGRLVVGDRAPDLAAGAVRRGVAEDEIGVMPLAAAGEQARRRPRHRRPRRQIDLAVEPGVAAAGGERRGDEAGAFAEHGLVGEADEAGLAQDAAAQHQPRALAERDPGQPVGPAVADEGLDDRGLGVVVERDLGGEMVGGAGRDMDDLDQPGRRMVAAEPERQPDLPARRPSGWIGLGRDGADLDRAEPAAALVEPAVDEQQPRRLMLASIQGSVRKPGRRASASAGSAERSLQRQLPPIRGSRAASGRADGK